MSERTISVSRVCRWRRSHRRTVTAINETWTDPAARQYAAAAIRERVDAEAWGSFNVETIEVSER